MGTFVVSLDFELHWGVRDHRTVADYRENLLGVRNVVPRLLDLFSEYGIHATWATVGFLFFENREELLESLPAELPRYQDVRLDPYRALEEVGKDEIDDPFHFAPSLISMIQARENQEIATHTFSHFYAMAEGPTLESFRADLRAARLVAQRRNIETKSIVFPRNQVSQDHVRICSEEGLIAYRGLECDPLVAAGAGTVSRIKRLADAYVDVSGPGCGEATETDDLRIVSVPQSRFLRPCTERELMANLRLRRICSGMTVAARNSKLFHLWWHPHNFGKNLEPNLAFLKKILDHYRALQSSLGFQSSTMAEVAQQVLAGVQCPAS